MRPLAAQGTLLDELCVEKVLAIGRVNMDLQVLPLESCGTDFRGAHGRGDRPGHSFILLFEVKRKRQIALRTAVGRAFPSTGQGAGLSFLLFGLERLADPQNEDTNGCNRDTALHSETPFNG